MIKRIIGSLLVVAVLLPIPITAAATEEISSEDVPVEPVSQAELVPLPMPTDLIWGRDYQGSSDSVGSDEPLTLFLPSFRAEHLPKGCGFKVEYFQVGKADALYKIGWGTGENDYAPLCFSDNGSLWDFYQDTVPAWEKELDVPTTGSGFVELTSGEYYFTVRLMGDGAYHSEIKPYVYIYQRSFWLCLYPGQGKRKITGNRGGGKPPL